MEDKIVKFKETGLKVYETHLKNPQDFRWIQDRKGRWYPVIDYTGHSRPEFKVRFDYNDEIWYMADNHAKSMTVVNYSIDVHHNAIGKTGFYMISVMYDVISERVQSFNAFSTKEELLKSL